MSARPSARPASATVQALHTLHRELAACRACSGVVGPVVHGAALRSRIYLLGQAPGPREGSFGRPFAWTAGRTLFQWWQQAVGATEDEVRARVYFAAVLRCFPGKAPGGGDRRPDAEEIQRCSRFIAREIQVLAPRLVLPVGALAIEQVLGHKGPLAQVVGQQHRAQWHHRVMDVIPLPHPSGASTWHRTEPGRTLLERAMQLVAQHPEVRQVFREVPASTPPNA
jgi:uracil-DNA glycosylase